MVNSKEDNEAPQLTSKFGQPISNNQSSETAGDRGPLLHEDTWLFEKMQHFNRERIPERVVHAKGYGAFGTFTVTQDATKYTKAKFLSEVGKQTPVLARFSTVAGSLGSADTALDPRGFSVKFFTTEGNWDMVGNNTPIFFIRDPLKFNDFIKSQKKDPGSNLKWHARRWDYWSLAPEALHQVMILYSDRGTPVSARFMNGYGSHTFSLWTEEGKRVWCKFHFKTNQGIKNLTPSEATQKAGEDADYSASDLWHAINRNEYPSWTMYIQVMTEEEADKYEWHPFDLTKVWPKKDFPLIEVGKLELNGNPDNWFEQVEQAAFQPSSLVPGIGVSPDPVLQNRLLSYQDAHIYRLGTNYQQIEVNRPLGCPVFNPYHRDGTMRIGNGDGKVDYEPNTFNGARVRRSENEPSMKVNGDGGRYQRYTCDDKDYFGQPMMLWNDVFTQKQRDTLVSNLAFSLSDTPRRIALAVLPQFYKVSEEFGEGVANALGIKKAEVPNFSDVLKNHDVSQAESS